MASSRRQSTYMKSVSYVLDVTPNLVAKTLHFKQPTQRTKARKSKGQRRMLNASIATRGGISVVTAMDQVVARKGRANVLRRTDRNLGKVPPTRPTMHLMVHGLL